jgi:hypothetical protein
VPKKSKKLRDVLVQRVGLRRATVIMMFVSLWSLYKLTEGEYPTRADELADAIERDQATVYRWLAEFREAFEPEGWSTPTDLLTWAGEQRTLNARQVGSLRWAR